ncbi:hypothetical protein A2954_01030 [Candidatus Roizmanbacteria bacterium RIFCSPLOWO2_01_FULL_37_12]|uniref:Ribbon-helix-helix protein CopG domain-containing protein n=1 Tax=Candidatus Roizmanbacteria bacterium RIFCSPLOWO2_01_FULL_37_12 TaxID=1802056 RepID=A0A1F7IGC7_9BACT|nr:MAG: hypothetical protein A3D76_00255 [Candidatus Roizmanbacteria bacterium RIFCSPHIGHO2_02_FULL_37_9b]OGK42410.1 MAG: hypothetical protein A2954_01030 [Candidatus Roizmanbacteria bacterium RIFCSPLOWO2_01_FULL_37_12]
MQTQTFNIALPKELVKKIDATAKKEYKNRSEFIREAVRKYLLMQEGNFSWDILAEPFRKYAVQKKLTQKDVLTVVNKVRNSGKNSKDSK